MPSSTLQIHQERRPQAGAAEHSHKVAAAATAANVAASMATLQADEERTQLNVAAAQSKMQVRKLVMMLCLR